MPSYSLSFIVSLGIIGVFCVSVQASFSCPASLITTSPGSVSFSLPAVRYANCSWCVNDANWVPGTVLRVNSVTASNAYFYLSVLITSCLIVLTLLEGV